VWQLVFDPPPLELQDEVEVVVPVPLVLAALSLKSPIKEWPEFDSPSFFSPHNRFCRVPCVHRRSVPVQRLVLSDPLVADPRGGSTRWRSLHFRAAPLAAAAHAPAARCFPCAAFGREFAVSVHQGAKSIAASSPAAPLHQLIAPFFPLSTFLKNQSYPAYVMYLFLLLSCILSLFCYHC